MTMDGVVDHDSFKGFRAGKIHLQFIFETNPTTATSMNNVHLTPQATQHLMSFIELFGAEKSPPIRMGRLFPDITGKPPSFGRHLASLRFTFALSPFTLGYFIRDETMTTNDDGKHEPLGGESGNDMTAASGEYHSREDGADERREAEMGTATGDGAGRDDEDIERHTTLRGVKARVDRFELELVMEQYEKTPAELPEHSMMKTGFGVQDVMVDLVSLDARAVMASQVEYDLGYRGRLDMMSMLEEIDLFDDGDEQDEQGDDHEQQQQQQHGHSEEEQAERVKEKLRILQAWLDEADFEDIDMPRISRIGAAKVTPFIYAPRTIYFKQGKSTSPMNRLSMTGKDVRDIQLGIFEERRSVIMGDIARQTALLEELYTQSLPPSTAERSHRRAELSRLKANLKIAAQQLTVVERHLSMLESNDHGQQQAPVFARHSAEKDDAASSTSTAFERMDDEQASQSDADTFDHRCVVHNAHIIWNIELRNQMFRYTRLLTRQHAIRYYMTATAVKAIRDTARKIMRNNERALSIDNTASLSAHQRLDDYEVDHSLLVMFTYPQVSFQSGHDNSTLVFLSAEQIQLESLSILDPLSENNTSNYLVKTRNILHIKDIQVFVAHRVHCMARSRSSLASQYGSSRGRWQDWLPVDVLVDYDGESGPFQRVVSRASATLCHDKRNPMRFTAQSTPDGDAMAASTTHAAGAHGTHGTAAPWSMHTDGAYGDADDDDQGETVTDMLFIHVPALVFTADALQFASIWSVANDLLAYREPDEHLDQINNILLASESNDYAVIVDTILEIQEKIHGLRQAIERYLLDRHTWLATADSMTEQYYSEDFARLIDQHRAMRETLYVIVTTMIRAQQLRERRRQATKTVIRTVMTADRVVWLMVDDDSKDPLCECTLYHANLVWVMGDDQSSSNTLEIDRLEVIDRMPKAYFVELLYPLVPEGKTVDFTRRKMLRVHWRELAPVAGITVVEHFEVNLFPCIVRLTQEVGRRIMAYAFPEKQRLRLHQESMLQAKAASAYPAIVAEEVESASGDDVSQAASLTGQVLREEPESLDDPMASPSSATSLAMPASRPRTNTRRLTLTTNVDDDANRTFIYVKVPSTQLCLSYRGRKEKDISNLNDFLFNLPTFEYRNKTFFIDQ
ncbi:golgi-body localization protein domain-containing protein [Syncephalis pseudoplumigaleata]|uniref:Golgi-body localization protein domain-containing protein n=1 Tax=Syncephalis pseudoplumigaleata TaxID=1712513 RepID=A0A4P9Z0W8_9FUNG|nr:golgi-body localization protein domain-containing protein [Syncephalis pseudoplumigaleata]|eukprot:RKP25351.1 golgi-body localization protein domain-containing protein [Syncephalis pseudoplumigaleata]